MLLRPASLPALLALVALPLGLGGCSGMAALRDGQPGRGYFVESTGWIVHADSTVWSCDATGGTPQCWRVQERD